MGSTSTRLTEGELISNIQQLRADIEQAVAANDWEKVVPLDKALRASVEQAVDVVKSDEAREVLGRHLNELQDFYQQLVEQGTEYRASVVRELQALRKNTNAANLYLAASKQPR